MTDQPRLPPRITSEIASRLHANVPELRQILTQDEVTTTTQSFEGLLQSVWLLGYADGLTDSIDSLDGKDSELLIAVTEAA